jgi:hypothetical protein
VEFCWFLFLLCVEFVILSLLKVSVVGVDAARIGGVSRSSFWFCFSLLWLLETPGSAYFLLLSHICILVRVLR